MGTFSPPPVQEERERRWVFPLIGLLAVVVVIAIVVITGRKGPQVQPSGPAPEAAYAGNLAISDLRLSQAENFAGGTVTYLEGQIANNGMQAVTAATVEVVFRDSLGQVVLREPQPLKVLHERMGAYMDVEPLSADPLGPNAVKEFRLTFEHIPADWNRGYPELRITSLTLK